jgi:hypothetical protein
MGKTIEMGQAALPTWRGAIANRLAPPAAKRTKLTEDQVRAAIGAAFFAVATFYVVNSLVRMIRTAKRS